MPFPAVAAGIGLGLSAVGSVAQIFGGAKRRKQAREAAENFRRQKLTNVYKDLAVSRMGADLQSEQQARFQSSAVNALTAGGVRGVVGGLTALGQQGDQVQRQIGASLDQQKNRIDQMIAGDEGRIQQMQEARESQELAAIQAQMNAGDATMQTGLGGLAQTGFSAAAMDPKLFAKKPKPGDPLPYNANDPG